MSLFAHVGKMLVADQISVSQDFAKQASVGRRLLSVHDRKWGGFSYNWLHEIKRPNSVRPFLD